MEQIVVGMAECRVGSDPSQMLSTFALGSCIGLAVYDPQIRVGGMAHFMLPDSSIDPERGRRNPSMFADTAIPELLDAMAGLGAKRARLVAYAAGGARMMGDERIFNIGRRNCEALRRHVDAAGIELRRAVVGGVVSRNLRLDIGTGKIWLWESGALVNAGEPKDTSPDRRRFRDRP
jgi:chemotaxis protein CheD